MWWVKAFIILSSLSYKAKSLLVCECIGQGEWYTCNNHPDDMTLDCMAEQLWAEKEKLA